MKKIKIFCVSKTGDDKSEESFLKNVCTYLKSHKQLEEYIVHKYIIDHLNHFASWLELRDLKDTNEARALYISGDTDAFVTYSAQFCGKYCYLDSEAVATAFRFAFCEPVGASYESPEESLMYNKKLFKELTDMPLEESLKKLEEILSEAENEIK